MTTVLITGATGALGSAVTKYLNGKDGYKVFTTGRNAGVADFQLNITDDAQLSKIIEHVKPDVIIQLAATFTHDFDDAYAINVDANRKLLEIIKRSSIKTRILLIGSAAEYGIVKPEESPISEEHVLNPVSVYGLTKAWQTQLAMYYSSSGVDVVVARVFNLKGENLSDKLFIGRLQNQMDQMLSGKKSSIELGSLSASRDYLSIDEAVQQIMLVVEFGKSGSVYNVASGQPIVMRDLLIGMLEKNKLDISVVQEATALSNRTGYDVPVIFADISKIVALEDMKIKSGVAAQ